MTDSPEWSTDMTDPGPTDLLPCDGTIRTFRAKWSKR